MRPIIIFIGFFIVTSFSSQTGIDASTDRIVIINSFDVQSLRARKNKKELFGQLADSLKYMLRHEFERTQSTYVKREIIVIPDFTNSIEDKDSAYSKFINGDPRTKVIVIKGLDAFFNQTGVEVTKEGSSKTRVASYDIQADIVYMLFGNQGKIKEFTTQTFEFFSERNVVSGMFAAGPDIVAKRKHAFDIVKKNAEQFVREVKTYFEMD